MSFKIRNYHPSDLSMLYRICLLTGDSGKDASHIYKDPDLLGQFYAAPYAVLEPDLCFILTNDDRPCGYILGTRDSEKFFDRCEAEWFPVLRKRYPLPAEDDQSMEAKIIRRIHEGHKPAENTEGYPAHLHIDLLPESQGSGMGRRLTEVFIDKLKELNVPGLHLGVGKKNTGAVKFYEKIGFKKIGENEFAITFGMKFR